MALPNVAQGDPHVQAHNDERSKINEIDSKTFRIGAPMRPRSIIPFGDSRDYMDVGLLSEAPDSLRTPATAYQVGGSQTFGYYSWANYFLGGALIMKANAGVPGNTTTQMLSRLTSALALVPDRDIFAVQAGANDWTVGVSAGQTGLQIATLTIANLTAIYDATLAAGKTLFIQTLVPRGGAAGTTMAVSDGRIYLSLVNSFITEYARTHSDVLFADISSVMTDPTTGTPYNGTPYFVTSDQTHQNSLGAMLMGKVIASAISSVITPISNFNGMGTFDPYNFSRNPANAGNSGTVANGVTGTPGSLINVGTVSGTAVCAVSKVPRTDGLPGEWTRLTIGPANTATIAVTLGVLFDSSGVAGVKVGDRIRVAQEVRTSGLVMLTGGSYQGGVLATSPNGAQALGGTWALSGGTVPDGVGAFVVDNWPIGAGATFLNQRILVGASAGVFDFGRNSIRKVS